MRSTPISVLRDPQTRKVGVLALGGAVGTFSMILATPVLTRIYSPQEFGDFAVLFATLGVLAPIAALRLEFSIPIPQVASEAWNAFMLCLTTALAFAVCIALVVVANPSGLGRLIGLSHEAAWLIWALPIGVALSGVQQSMAQWGIRTNRLAAVSQGRAGQGLLSSGSQLALGLSGIGVIGLVVGDIIGRAFAGIWMLTKVVLPAALGMPRPSVKVLIRVLSRYRKFLLLSTPSTLANSLSASLPLLAAGKCFGLEAAGYLLLAQRMIGLPASLLTSSVSQVFIVELSRASQSHSKAALYWSTVRRYALLTGPIFLVGGLASPIVFPWIFGQEWRNAGILALVLAPFFFMQLLSGSTVSTLDVLQAHWTRFFREIVFLVGIASIVGLREWLELDILGFVSAVSIYGVSFYAVSLAWVHRIILRDGQK